MMCEDEKIVSLTERRKFKEDKKWLENLPFFELPKEFWEPEDDDPHLEIIDG